MTCEVSVLLPINRGLPWLPVAVRDVLKQDVDGKLELICSWDGGTEADWLWLLELKEALGEGATVVEAAGGGEGRPAKAEEDWDSAAMAPLLSATEVAKSRRRPDTAVKIVRYADRRNRGQGAAMSLALAHAEGRFVAQMEADDARPRADALKTAVRAIAERGWDGACAEAFCFGSSVSPRMMAYCDWQNSLTEPTDLFRERFVEIPALHQTAVFPRAVVDAVLGDRGYRDGPAESDHGPDIDAPVDLWWWLSFFEKGFACGRVVGRAGKHQDAPGSASSNAPSASSGGPLTDPPADTFFGWRQHPGQRTRAQGRLALENLRRIKIHFLLRASKPVDAILVLSVGATLRAWTTDLRHRTDIPVLAREWRPPKKVVVAQGGAFPVDATRASHDDDKTPGKRLLRLWAYGDARVRARARAIAPDWLDDWDLFVA
mmetsp:Transcript_13330/g.43464  ORF Transcript_13330/g.43464 Transcript_13330/m.43464 type:complete len:432 (+) Transcript_13330:1646-2941(+)